MSDFISNNWLSIASILIGVLVAYVFYRLQQKDSASAASERTKHATSDLLDVVESYVINKQDLSRTLIDNLIQAAERFHKVSLSSSCTPITLLQDVSLRLQRSRHLDIPQKSNYSTKIEELISDVRTELEPLTWERMRFDSSEIITEVLAVVPVEHRQQVEEDLNKLGMIGEIAKNEGALTQYSERLGKMSWLSVATTALSGVAAAMVVATIGNKLFFDSVIVTPGQGRLISTLTITSALIITTFFVSYALRWLGRYRAAAENN
ncbi:hypothetical protein C1882_10505 [Pseudomonas sp. FW305-E2]|uniref:hypothetical protein n=1 Tax=Pseudomonas sp. FW305-E2 TaxID=2075558 RepID=UPI000B4EC0A8|nr:MULTISPECIES: hypothetical protein [Pseudomonas]POA86211.1 hypothetical protein C1882_10505 [Pseudomonas sp. FW305-E2]